MDIADSEDNSRGNLTDGERNGRLQSFLSLSKSGKLPIGAIQETASKFQVVSKAISRIWKRAQEYFSKGLTYAEVSSKIKFKSGRKKKDREEISNKILQVPLQSEQISLESLALASHVPTKTLHRVMKERVLKRISTTIKPTLTAENKRQHLEFALANLEKHSACFNPMLDTVHVDEKWFYLTKVKQSFYLLPDSDARERSFKSKRFITKVMFLAAVARPRSDTHGKTMFDGKIGLWQLVLKEPAKRNSKNRSKETMATKSIEVTRDVYISMIVDK